MAMSLKKIGAMAIGGAMVATALASGVAADVTVVGDVTKDLFVKDGQPNCYVVVGANAPSTMDVVSAADIAAKIGSLCYKEGTVEDGSADIILHAKADSNDVQFKGKGAKIKIDKGGGAGTVPDETLITAADDDYASDFAAAAGPNLNLKGDGLGLDNKNKMSLRNLPTLLKIEDIDPDDWRAANKDGDAGEVILAELDDKDKTANSYNYAVPKNKAIYMSIEYADGATSFKTGTIQMQPGDRIPFLGQEYTVVKLDSNDDTIYLGKEAYDGILKQGESYDLGNGYSVKVKSVLVPIKKGKPKVDVVILKDGKEVASKDDQAPFEFVYGNIGVVVHSAYEDVGGNYGYADLVITKDTKALKLGKEYMPNWKAYAVYSDSTLKGPKNLGGGKSNDIYLSDKVDTTAGDDILCGIALKYTGDDVDNLDDGSKVNIANYVDLVIDDEGKTGKLYAYYSMDKSVDTTLNVGQKVKALNADVTLKDIKANAVEPVSLTAPIAKLDTEVSLDSADKNLVLVGGPVANKLTKELVDEGKISLNNKSPATIAVLKGEANGHDVVVVAGGDREKTREAALKLIKML